MTGYFYDGVLKALRARKDSLNDDAHTAWALVSKLNNIAEFEVDNKGALRKIHFKQPNTRPDQFLSSLKEASQTLEAIAVYVDEEIQKQKQNQNQTAK